MNCYTVQRSLLAYCDNSVPVHERRNIALHLAGCEACFSKATQLTELRRTLRALPAVAPPEDLSTSLRVLASRELARRSSRTSLGAFVSHFTLRVRLWMDDMMRPVALPVAGGFFAAVVLFATLVPTFASRVQSNIQDVPTGLSTEVTVAGMAPFGLSEDDIILDVTVDEQGRVIDYSTPSGQGWVNNPEARRNVENLLLFTRFNPGTMFGLPASGKVRITLRRSEIDVKG